MSVSASARKSVKRTDSDESDKGSRLRTVVSSEDGGSRGEAGVSDADVVKAT